MNCKNIEPLECIGHYALEREGTKWIRKCLKKSEEWQGEFYFIDIGWTSNSFNQFMRAPISLFIATMKQWTMRK